jgi:hypothetical protein
VSSNNVEVAKVLRGIARDLHVFGHYKEPRDKTSDIYNHDKGQGKCCLLVNPSLKGAESRIYTKAENIMRELAREKTGSIFLSEFSDRTPTQELREALISRAEELEDAS